jgi:hypothetical protein
MFVPREINCGEGDMQLPGVAAEYQPQRLGPGPYTELALVDVVADHPEAIVKAEMSSWCGEGHVWAGSRGLGEAVMTQMVEVGLDSEGGCWHSGCKAL